MIEAEDDSIDDKIDELNLNGAGNKRKFNLGVSNSSKNINIYINYYYNLY